MFQGYIFTVASDIKYGILTVFIILDKEKKSANGTINIINNIRYQLDGFKTLIARFDASLIIVLLPSLHHSQLG